MLGPFATTSRLTPIHQVSPLYCRTTPAHRCPQRRQRQRMTEGTAMAPWNGPKKATIDMRHIATSHAVCTSLMSMHDGSSVIGRRNTMLLFASLGPFYGAIAVPSVTRCRCCRCCYCCGHRFYIAIHQVSLLSHAACAIAIAGFGSSW